MGFLNKLGKIALQAAPYVAAPFTGGASLMATGATQKLGQKWAEHDAKKAIEKGVAPSKFDKYLGMASGVAGLASSAGALGKFGSAAYSGAKGAGGVAGKLTGWQDKLGKAGSIASRAMGNSPYGAGTEPQGGGGGWQTQVAQMGLDALMNRNRNPEAPQAPQAPGVSGFQQGLAQPRNGAMPRGGWGYDQNPVHQYDQNDPNLALALHQGRQEALMNQPWRAGYDVTNYDDEGNPSGTSRMPPISPQFQPPDMASSPFGDAMTKTYGRRRNPGN